jgi:hypothetical protein
MLVSPESPFFPGIRRSGLVMRLTRQPSAGSGCRSVTSAPGFLLRTLIAALWGLLLPVGAAEVQELKFNATREIYQAKRDQIVKEHEGQISSLLDKYRKALAGLKDQARKQGDLQTVLEVDKEIERLDKEKAPPAGAALSAVEGLREKQAICASTARDAELAKSRKIVDLAGEYTNHLEQEKKRLTIEGRFDVAKAHADEIERVTRGETESAATRVVQDENKEVAGPAGGPDDPNTTGMTDCIIHQVYPPPPINDVAMKPQSLLGTRLGGRISQIIASARIGTINNMEVTRSSYSRTESGKIGMILRLELKTHPSLQEIRDVWVLVQYFGTDAGARGIIKPRQIGAEPVRLAALSPKSVTIDFPAIEIEKHEYRSRDGGYSSKSGQDYHGLMVTVFGNDNAIIYQAVTHTTLQDHGESALAEVKLAQGRIDLRAARSAYERARDAYQTAADGDGREDLLRRYYESRSRYQELKRRLGL